MNAREIIESYIVDVAAQLPRRQRADVAAELRSLLGEEIGASATADETLARLRAFGRPAEVAARYHTPYAVIDPVDTHNFVLALIAGALLIPSTNQRLPFSIDHNTAALWFLAWLGVLVILFALKSWAARRWPQYFQWKPSKVRDYDRVRAIEQLPLIAILVFYETVYLVPGPAIHLLTGGRVDQGVLTYTADFASPLRMWWFAAIVPMLVVLEAMAMVRGRWTRLTRTIEITLFLLAGTQLGWHASYGSIFMNAQADYGARMAFQLVGAACILTALYKIYREWGRIPPVVTTTTPVTR
ncbi:MAG: hypothetical protein ISS15_02290 [Alphaproteobacteria bacterium]|nr:hypothetical protein [Alphaproteobacteria bacterium]MBL6938403.1 hypothetical protein [Alphaproteobacteria bacterium]MBL7096462.1 hypothetical protein [Alphaproteobacteria bacterium]